MVFLNSVLLDPIALLELLALGLTASYIGKLTFAQSAEEAGNPSAGNTKLCYSFIELPTASIQQRLQTAFEVGTLISTPKRSLRRQRAS